MRLADLVLTGQSHSDAWYAAIDDVNAGDAAEVMVLSGHASAAVREAVMNALPFLTNGDPPSAAMVETAIRGTTDSDARVRDWACFALGQQWHEQVDTPELRQALADRLDDDDPETAREALVGLAFRRDPRALPRVRDALSRPDDSVWLLEMTAAGALSDPSLHELVLGHQDGWEESGARTAAAARRLTDPAGPGDDVLDGVAGIYRRRAHRLPDPDAMWAWTAMLEMLNIAPYRAVEFFEAVVNRLADDEDALHELRTESALAQMAADQAG